MNTVSKVILKVTNRIKPILLKIFPKEFLRKIKGKITAYTSIQKLEDRFTGVAVYFKSGSICVGSDRGNGIWKAGH